MLFQNKYWGCVSRRPNAYECAFVFVFVFVLRRVGCLGAHPHTFAVKEFDIIICPLLFRLIPTEAYPNNV